MSSPPVPSPADAGTTSGGGVFTNGASVTLMANATNSCYHFANWEKGTRTAGTSPSYTFTVASPEALVAHFAQIEDNIQTLSNPAYGGTTKGGGSKGCGSKVTVTATTDAGFKFIGWSVDGAVGNRTNSSYTFTAEGDETLTAEFSDIQAPTISITSPKTGVKVNTSLLTITGTAKENSGVASVYCALNEIPFAEPGLLAATTNNYTNWSARVLLSPGTNEFYAVAQGKLGPSKTNSITIINKAAGQAPVSLAGLVAQITKGTNPPVEINFGEATFDLLDTDTNAGPGVANYTYTQTGPDTAQLVSSFIAPPNKTDKTNTSNLTFTSPSSGTFSNTTDGTMGTITLSPGSDLELHSAAGATVVAVDSTTGATHTTSFGNGTFTEIDSVGANSMTNSGVTSLRPLRPAGHDGCQYLQRRLWDQLQPGAVEIGHQRLFYATSSLAQAEGLILVSARSPSPEGRTKQSMWRRNSWPGCRQK